MPADLPDSGMRPRALCTSSDVIGAVLDLRADGLSPGQRVDVHCRALDTNKAVWTSWAAFVSDDRGQVDVRSSPAVDGAYRGVDAGGLLWALEPEGPGATDAAVSRIDYQFEVRVGDAVVATPTCSRFGLAPGLEQTDVDEEGVRGVLFSPPGGEPRPGVAVFGGNAGHHSAWPRAAFFANRGFVTLLVAYCGDSGLPPCAGPIRVEDLRAAIGWLATSDRTTGDRVGVYGHSSGGTAALLAAQGNPHVGAVALMATSPVVLPISAPKRRSPWTLGGQPITPVGVGGRGLARFFRQEESTQAALIDAALGVDALADAFVDLDSIDAPILLMHGSDDALLPVRPARALTTTLDRRGDGSSVVIHEGAGHLYRIPGLPGRDTRLRRLLGVEAMGGGSTEANALATADAWPRTLSLFDERLGRPSGYRSSEVVVDLDAVDPDCIAMELRCIQVPPVGTGSWTLSVIGLDDQWVRVGGAVVDGEPRAIYRTPSEPDGILTVRDPLAMRLDVRNSGGAIEVSVDGRVVEVPGSSVQQLRLRTTYATFGEDELRVAVDLVESSVTPRPSDVDQPGVSVGGTTIRITIPAPNDHASHG